MKSILKKICCVFLGGIVAMSACKKETITKSTDTFITEDFVYNLAIKTFTPGNEVTGEIESSERIQLIYYYLIRNGQPPLLVHSDEPTEEEQLSFSYRIPNTAFESENMEDVTGLKIMVKHQNSSNEGFVKITPFMPEKPKLVDFQTEITPDLSGEATVIRGVVMAESGLNSIDIYDNYRGDFELISSIGDLNNIQEYTLDYDYMFRKGASQLKIEATDAIGVKSEILINLNVVYPYNLFVNLTMMAQGSATVTSLSSIFIGDTGELLGNCELNASEPTMTFLFYTTGSGPSFYSPANAAGVAKNFRCNGTPWTIGNLSEMKATKFRVLVPGNSAVDAFYEKYNAGEIDNMEDETFTGISDPSSSAVRYETGAPAGNIFNTETAYLIYFREPLADGSHRNGIIRAKEVNIAGTGGLSTIVFDVMMDK